MSQEKKTQFSFGKSVTERLARVSFSVWALLGAVAISGGLVWLAFSEPADKAIVKDELLTVTDADYVAGPKDAPVVLVEYLDFECEACGAYYPLVKRLKQDFPDDLRVVTRYFPLTMHKNGMTSALAAEAAAQQGKFQEMHDLLFTEQRKWGRKPTADPALFEEYARTLELDVARFQKDVTASTTSERVARDVSSGMNLGITGTPSFFLNGEKIDNPKSYEDFKVLVQAVLVKYPRPQAEGEGAQVLGEKTHQHADFAVYLSGQKIDFTQAKYQSSDEAPLDADTHLHDGVGTIIHKHRMGITLGYFFQTLGMRFENECFATDDGTRFCATSEKKLMLYVNGVSNSEMGAYEFSDGDQILITYGDGSAVNEEINTITDQACIYSETCPERGKPPTESCVGGLGTEC